MSFLGDFHNLKASFRSTLLGVLVEAAFVYVCAFFIVPDFINTTTFHIPILLSICIGLLNIVIWNAFVIENSSEDFKGENDSDVETIWIITTLCAISQTSFVGLICYLSEAKLLTYSLFLIGSSFLFAVLVTKLLSSNSNSGDKNKAKTNG